MADERSISLGWQFIELLLAIEAKMDALQSEKASVYRDARASGLDAWTLKDMLSSLRPSQHNIPRVSRNDRVVNIRVTFSGTESDN